MSAMKAKLIPIGDSLGVCIPKSLIDEAELLDDVHLSVVGTAILIQSDSSVRVGWGNAARDIVRKGEDGLIDDEFSTDFDESEWVWE